MEFKQNKEDFEQQATYLSEKVKKLVCYQPEAPSCGTVEQWYPNDDLLNWLTSSHTCNYQQAISCLYPLSSAIHLHFKELTTKDFCKKYQQQLEWTSKSNILKYCFELLTSPHSGSIEASLLLVTSTLERILGDFFIACSDAAQCPSLLKDLLQMSELKDVLGETFMFCLEVYIGSPSGLNLRNLAWHGFLSKGELQPRHVSFLLMCAISLGENVKRKLKNTTSVEHLEPRSLITYPKTSLLQGIFPEIEITNLAVLFHTSAFVTSSMVEMWDLAIELYQQKRFAEVVMVLLPELEHSLRRIYASCNNLPERLLTAESSEFYTTFNEILSPVLSDNTPNLLVTVIGPCFVEILLDILVHKSGPRLRDHISHGEVDMEDFPKHLADHILNIVVAFCHKFSSGSSDEHQQRYSKTVQSYSSMYHPTSCLRQEFLSFLDGLLKWKTLPRPSDEDFLCVDDENLIDFKGFCNAVIKRILSVNNGTFSFTDQFSEEHGSSFNETVFQIVLDILYKRKLLTLFRPRRELEVVSLLRNIVDQCSQASRQIHDIAHLRYEEWKDKKLRSRQRQNYKRFWYHFPFINKTLVIIIVILATELTNVENIVNQDTREIKEFLKEKFISEQTSTFYH